MSDAECDGACSDDVVADAANCAAVANLADDTECDAVLTTDATDDATKACTYTPCTDCPAGQYQADIGVNVCEACPAGKTSVAGWGAYLAKNRESLGFVPQAFDMALKRLAESRAQSECCCWARASATWFCRSEKGGAHTVSDA